MGDVGAVGRSKARVQLAQQFADECVAAFDTSGFDYTCAAVVMAVAAPLAARLCVGTDVKPRRVVRLAVDAVHARKYP